MSAWDNSAFVADTVDDTAQATGMAGPATVVNQGIGGSGVTPTRALVYAWFFFLALYWALGFVFKGRNL